MVLDQLIHHILNTQHNLVVQVVVVMVLTGQLVLSPAKNGLTTPEAAVVEVETMVKPKGGFGGAGILVIRYQPGS